MRERKKLGLAPLIAATYFMVSGGPYGLEDLVAQGYGIALAALAVTPWIWSLPVAFMVGELASALPEEGGYYAWVRRGLGPFWGFQEAWLSLAASAFDMAIYPTLFTLYLGRVVPVLGAQPWAFMSGAAVIALSAAWNLRGASSVGRGAIALGCALLAPFAVLVGLAVLRAGHAGVSGAHDLPGVVGDGRASLGDAILVAMWNGMGWDNASTVAIEVERPARTYPRAVLGAVALVTLTYVAPVGAMALAGVDPAGWTTGSWVDAARSFGGPPLAAAVVVGGMLCGAGMFNALLLSYSRVPAALADDGLLPRGLGERDGNGAPRPAIIACSIAYVLCLGIGFRHLVALDVLLYGLSLVLEFAALAILRRREPALERPFRIPGGVGTALLAGAMPVALLLFAAWSCRSERIGSVPSLVVGAAIVLLGPIAYAFRSR